VSDLSPALIRTQVELPLALADGSETTARVFTFDGLVDGREHLALELGEPSLTPLVRLHSECLTGDALGSLRCDCGPQLAESLVRLCAAGGYLLYLRQEGRDIGLYDKLDSYVLQDRGLDTFEANLALGHDEDERDYTAAAQMLRALGVASVTMLTNNPDKIRQLRSCGIAVENQLPTAVHLRRDNERYLRAKATRGGHTLDLSG
jgi:GTP cyclohydrolase II